MKEVTLKPSLVFNWVIVFRGLLSVNSNGKFRSFLVWILIQKDNTDKIFKKEFYTKK